MREKFLVGEKTMPIQKQICLTKEELSHAKRLINEIRGLSYDAGKRLMPAIMIFYTGKRR